MNLTFTLRRLAARALPIAAGLCLAVASTTTFAQTAPTVEAAATPEKLLPQVKAEVRRIDPAAGKISLKHGEIPNLDMPPMTMVFQVKNATLLDGLKVGDPVTVTVDEIKGALTVITLQR